MIGLAIWGAAMITLVAAYGWNGLLPAIGWFFTKAALLTFGGAYAVLPYVFQGAVEKYRWLTAIQMIDGLALGETTPGPLIMVVAFVGIRRRLQAGALRRRVAVAVRRCGGKRGHLFHFSAELPLHPGRWPDGRDNPR